MSDKPVIWSFDRKTEIASIDGSVKREDYRQLCYPVVDAVLEIRERGIVRPEHLHAFAATMECSYEYVFCHGGRRIVQCCHFSEDARRLMISLMGHPKWRVRLNTVAITDYCPPEPILVEVLRLGLTDQSKRVRDLSASKILMQRMESLIDDLEQRASCEDDGALKERFHEVAQLIRGEAVVRDGMTMTLEPDEEGTYSLIAHYAGGHVGKILSCIQRHR